MPIITKTSIYGKSAQIEVRVEMSRRKYNDVLEFATYYGDASLWANKMYFHGLTEDRQHHIPK